MKTVKELITDGYKLLAYSSDGAFNVTSFIAIYAKHKVYGFFDHKLNRYVIQPA